MKIYKMIFTPNTIVSVYFRGKSEKLIEEQYKKEIVNNSNLENMGVLSEFEYVMLREWGIENFIQQLQNNLEKRNYIMKKMFASLEMSLWLSHFNYLETIIKNTVNYELELSLWLSHFNYLETIVKNTVNYELELMTGVEK